MNNLKASTKQLAALNRIKSVSTTAMTRLNKEIEMSEHRLHQLRKALAFHEVRVSAAQLEYDLLLKELNGQ